MARRGGLLAAARRGSAGVQPRLMPWASGVERPGMKASGCGMEASASGVVGVTICFNEAANNAEFAWPGFGGRPVAEQPQSTSSRPPALLSARLHRHSPIAVAPRPATTLPASSAAMGDRHDRDEAVPSTSATTSDAPASGAVGKAAQKAKNASQVGLDPLAGAPLAPRRGERSQ